MKVKATQNCYGSLDGTNVIRFVEGQTYMVPLANPMTESFLRRGIFVEEKPEEEPKKEPKKPAEKIKPKSNKKAKPKAKK